MHVSLLPFFSHVAAPLLSCYQLAVSQLLAITAHLEPAIKLECLVRRFETDNCPFNDLTSQIPFSSALGLKNWSHVGVSWVAVRLSHGDWSESLGDAAEPFTWVPAAEMDFVLVSSSSFQPILWNLFSCVQSLISLQNTPHMAPWQAENILACPTINQSCAICQQVHIIFAAVLIDLVLTSLVLGKNSFGSESLVWEMMDSVFPIFIELLGTTFWSSSGPACAICQQVHSIFTSVLIDLVLTSLVLGTVSASVVERGPSTLVLATWQ